MGVDEIEEERNVPSDVNRLICDGDRVTPRAELVAVRGVDRLRPAPVLLRRSGLGVAISSRVEGCIVTGSGVARARGDES